MTFIPTWLFTSIHVYRLPQGFRMVLCDTLPMIIDHINPVNYIVYRANKLHTGPHFLQPLFPVALNNKMIRIPLMKGLNTIDSI
jgi:hypothetical protein